MRFFESSGPLNLAPGGRARSWWPTSSPRRCRWAAARAPAATSSRPTTNDNLTILGDPARMAVGRQRDRHHDRVPGQHQRRRRSDTDPTKVTQDEFVTRAGLAARQGQDRADRVRQQVPAAVRARPAGLLPGPGRQPGHRPVEPVGDRDHARSVLRGRQPAHRTPDGAVNALYDPNFRGLDVEGYRIYRGRTSNPSELELIAQFDYAPDPADGKGIFTDFRGTVNPVPGCAPELGVLTDCAPTLQPPPAPGQPVRRVGGRRSGRDRHPGHPGQPRAAGQRQRRRSCRASWTPRSPTSARGRVAQGVSTAAHQQRRAVPLRRPQRPEQPAVLLLGRGVRRELGRLGSVEPRVASGATKAGHAGAAARPTSERRGHRDHDRPDAPAADQHHGADRSTRPPASSAGRCRRPMAARLGLVQTVSQMLGGPTTLPRSSTASCWGSRATPPSSAPRRRRRPNVYWLHRRRRARRRGRPSRCP